MVQIKEIYIWIGFFILVIAGAAYLRFYYQPTISLSVNFLNTQPGTLYPFEQVSEPIAVQNIGSSGISNLSFGLYINNNLSRTYRISIPSGKTAMVYFNFTPAKSGTSKITFIADPNKLYNIADRSNAQGSVNVSISAPEIAEPYVLFSSNGLLGEDVNEMTPEGYELSVFLFNNTASDEFALSGSEQINSFIYPALDVYYNYIKNISVGHAYYENYTLVSVWLRGYLTPNALAEVAIGKGFNVSYEGNMTIIDFGKNTTLCSWYSNGWIKSLGSIDGANCSGLLNVKTYEKINTSYELRFAQRNNKIYNYSGFFENYSYSGQWSLSNTTPPLYQSIQRGSNFTNVCYGSIQELDNISYCNTYFLEVSNTVLVKTNALIGSYNLTAWGFTTQKDLINQSSINVDVIKAYNVTGTSGVFVTGFLNSCTLSNNLYCFTSTWNYSELTIGLVNYYNSSVLLNKIGCYTDGTVVPTVLNRTVLSKNYTYITIPCYQNGTAISGVPLGLNVHLIATYNVSGNSTVVEGTASLVK